MTDARLPGYWLNEMRFQDLTDKQWRVFTNLLMWSVEQGTDGHVPARYVNTVHLDGVKDEDLDALVTCGVLERVSDGVQMLRWDDANGLRQSLAATVEAYRARKRDNQRASRAARKARSVTGDMGGDVSGNVGRGYSSDSSSSAYTPGNRPGDVTGDRPRRHQFSAADDDEEPPPYSAPTPHEHEPNAISALTTLCKDWHLSLSADDLLPEAYRIGNGNPWDGYLEIKAATQQGFSGARNPDAVLRTRLRGISGPRPVIAKNDEWMYPPGSNVRTA